MINIETGRSINELVFNEIKSIIKHGSRTPSRNGDISTMYNTFAILSNPRSRHLSLVGRKNNIFATIAETFWVFSGDDKIDPLLSFFLPRAKDFSDDGKTWRGAYGPRLFGKNEALEDLVQQFKNEGIFTRRGVMSIFDPSLDTQKNLKEKYNLDNTKDRPCNLMMDFFVTPDKRLHMNMKQRSGDVLWGHGSINIFEMSLLQECVLNILQAEIDNQLTLGDYNHHVTNLHLYDFSGQQGYDVLENELKQKLTLENFQKVYTPTNPSGFIQFNKDICEVLEYGITNKTTDFEFLKSKMGFVFENLAIQENLYWHYALLCCAYVCAKNLDLPSGEKTDSIVVDLSSCDEEFKQCIRNSSFRKFNIKE